MPAPTARFCGWCGGVEEEVGPLACRQRFQGLSRLRPEVLCICRQCVAQLADLVRRDRASPIRARTGGHDLDAGIGAQMRQPRIVPVGDLRELSEGRWRLLTSVELWPWRVVVRWLENRGQPPPRRLHERWQLGDDCGTAYNGVGSGARGDGTWYDGEVEFNGEVPAAAARLIVITPEGVSVEVVLPGADAT